LLKEAERRGMLDKPYDEQQPQKLLKDLEKKQPKPTRGVVKTLVANVAIDIRTKGKDDLGRLVKKYRVPKAGSVLSPAGARVDHRSATPFVGLLSTDRVW
jgi:hypothetical protein